MSTGPFRLRVLVAALLACSVPAVGEVTTLQQGLHPTPEYAGCADTSIRGRGWARSRPQPKARTLTNYADTAPLIRFDLAPLGADRVVRRALLRLYYTDTPSDPAQEVLAWALGRAWDDTATWFEHSHLDGEKTEKNNWSTPGGDLDEADFGQDKPGLIARATVRGGPFGFVVELDVTRAVADWVAGRRANHGFKIGTKRGTLRVGSSEWPMPAYRPVLVIEHHARGAAPAGDVRLRLPEAPGPEAKLSDVAGTSDVRATGGKTAVVRFGRNANCRYRHGHMAGYAKQDVRFPGNWGWTPRIRVGGTGGDLNHAVFYFDLSAVPKDASIKRATLRAFADVGNMRPPDPDEALNQVPQADPKRRPRRLRAVHAAARAIAQYRFGLFALRGPGGQALPGWTEEAFTFHRPRPGATWPGGGGLTDATDPAPAAIAGVADQWADLSKQPETMPQTWLSWDVTGLVRAWTRGKRPNAGVVLDGRLMGGEMVLFSDDWVEPDRRPYLEIELTGRLAPPPDGPPATRPIVPAGDDWVGPMRKAHARWTGTPGTFAQYGDSITVTMAFWTPLRYTDGKGMPPEMLEALAAARKHIHKDVWHGWKGGKWGNAGNMTITWCFDNIDAWQKRMNPEAAVIMFGTNDAYRGPNVPIYTEQYAACVNRMLADGTVPIVTTLPPRYTQRLSLGGFMTVWNFRLATLFIARAKKVPLIDLWAEMVRRRPDDWDGKLEKFDAGGWKGYNVPTLMARDGIHPSNPKSYHGDFSQEGLRCSGFNLRNYLTLKTWYEIRRKVIDR